MKVVIIGSGGREHALGWKLGSEREDAELYFVPGNGGTQEIGRNIELASTDIEGIAKICDEIEPDLIVVGPEDPLAMGIVDTLGERFTVFGPSKVASRLESSKAFAKQLMSRYSIPTAPYRIFTSAAQAHAYIDRSPEQLVVKADGLARGKGSIVTETKDDAHRAVEMIMVERVFGEAGDVVVIEERLRGEEASILAITDGSAYAILPASQDHKPVFDDDRGPNTGGMGAYCPVPMVTDDVMGEIEETVIKRLLKGLRREGIEYRGVVYAGLMLNQNRISVIEFNVRFGDPETQCVLPAIDANLGDLLLKAATGDLQRRTRIKHARWAVSVVIASGGYPGSYEKGKVIEGIDEALAREGVLVFHAGTRRQNGSYLTNGGRVLAVTGTGSSLREARRTAYGAARLIRFERAHMRTDIGLKGISSLERTEVT